MLLIIEKILGVFAYVAVGLMANKKGILPDESVRYLNALIMKITAPCLILSSITSRTLDSELRVNTIIALVVPFVLYVAMAVLSLFVCRKMKLSYAGELSMAMMSPNCGFMGFPVTMAMFGDLIFYYIVIETIPFNIYTYVFQKYQLLYGDAEARSNDKSQSDNNKPSLAERIKPILNIITIAAIVAVAMLFTGLKFPAEVFDILDTIGGITVPLAMILVGVQLGGSNLRELISNRSLVITAVMKLLIIPAICMLLISLLPIGNEVKLSLVLSMVFPTAVACAIIAQSEDRNARIVSEAIALTTLLSMVTLPVWIIILQNFYLN